MRIGRSWPNEGAVRASGNAHGAPELGLSLTELSLTEASLLGVCIPASPSQLSEDAS